MDIEKEQRAINYLKMFEPKDEPYFLCYSGGKDSDTILALAKMAGVNFEAVHSLTTVDAPETVKYIKTKLDVKIDRPERSMWQLIVDSRMPPTRIVRYCCGALKERTGRGRKKITGVRWAESLNRKKNGGFVKILGKEKTMRKLAEEAGVDYEETAKGGMVLNNDNAESRAFVDHCYRTTSVMVNPIVDWTDDDVWQFLCHYGIEVNPLYNVKVKDGAYCPQGKSRIGCIGCPMQGGKGMKADFMKYPKYRDNYLRAFKRMQKKRIEDNIGAFGDEYSPEGMAPNLENHKDEFIYTESRHPDCPLREIPIPHGRLIDANIAVIRITKAILKFNRDKYGDESYMHDKLYDILEQTIDSVPTIIEAEGENDKL